MGNVIIINFIPSFPYLVFLGFTRKTFNKQKISSESWPNQPAYALNPPNRG